MHFQSECWRCSEYRVPSEGDFNNEVSEPCSTQTDSTGRPLIAPAEYELQPFSKPAKRQPCGRIFYSRPEFCGHLCTEHRVGSKRERKRKCGTSRIGAAGQDSFWCGFCEKIIQLEAKGIKAWDERFDHIDNDHFKSGMGINRWRSMGGTIKERKQKEKEFSARGTESLLSADENLDDGSRMTEGEYSPKFMDESMSSDESDADSQVEMIAPKSNFGVQGSHVATHASQDSLSAHATTTGEADRFLIGVGQISDGSMINNLKPNEIVLVDSTLSQDENDLVRFSQHVSPRAHEKETFSDVDDWENERNLIEANVQPQALSDSQSPDSSNCSSEAPPSTSSGSASSPARSSPPSPGNPLASETIFTEGTMTAAGRQNQIRSSAKNATDQIQCLESTGSIEKSVVPDANSTGAPGECQKKADEDIDMQLSNDYGTNGRSISRDMEAPPSAMIEQSSQKVKRWFCVCLTFHSLSNIPFPLLSFPVPHNTHVTSFAIDFQHQ